MFTRLSHINLSSNNSFNLLINKIISQCGYLLQSKIKCRVPENNNNYSIIYYNKSELDNSNIHIYGPFRSIIINSDNKVVCYSPPKSIDYNSFVNRQFYLQSYEEVIAQEFVEGTMINVFWDAVAGLWEISTKKIVGATSNFYKKQEGKSFRQMFFEALSQSGLTLDNLDSNYCYSFVLQHPENRIVVPFTKPCLYLIAIYSIEHIKKLSNLHDENDENDRDILVHNHDIYDSKVQEFFSKTTICFPKIYNFESYNSAVEQYASENTPYTTLGVVFYNKKTGERTKVRNPVYESVRQLKGNEPKLQFHYLTLRQQGKVTDFLHIFSEHKSEFMKFRNQVHTFTHTLFQNYVNCYIKKEKPVGDYGQQYKTHMFNIHSIYKNELKEKKMIVNNGFVINYVNNLEPQLLMYCLNYEFRKKIEQTVVQVHEVQVHEVQVHEVQVHEVQVHEVQVHEVQVHEVQLDNTV
jgi:hypothetical protein